MTEDESEPEKLTGDMFEAIGPDGTRHIFKASSFSAGTIIDPPGCNTFYHVHRPYNPDEPFCVWVDPLNNYYTNDDLAEIVRRCNAAHSPDTTMFISHVSDIANNCRMVYNTDIPIKLPLWWNWKTRLTQNQVSARTCRFNSYQGDHPAVG